MRTRIAPSPTGFMHIGTARTALFNYLAARATGGQFILRIDDTDTERNNEAAVAPILEGLAWLGLDYDLTFRQSERLDVYKEVGQRLLAVGLAFEADNGAIILRGAGQRDYWFDNIAGKIAISDKAKDEMNDKLVLLRGGDKLGQPTYHFASVVDDYSYYIDYVIRGSDHIANTAKQIAIWDALNKYSGVSTPFPLCSHIGLIFSQKKKMSKRDGAASLLDYRDKGYDPDAIFQYLTRLGWGPRVDDRTTTFLTREQTIGMFLTGGSMKSSNANFDAQKLDFYDRSVKKQKAKAAA